MKKVLLILLTIIASIIQVSAQPKSANIGGTPILRSYPNPAVSFISFDFEKDYNRGYSLQVYSFLGKKVYEANNISPKTTISMSDFNRGIYIYQLYDRTGKLVQSGKFQLTK